MAHSRRCAAGKCATPYDRTTLELARTLVDTYNESGSGPFYSDEVLRDSEAVD